MLANVVDSIVDLCGSPDWKVAIDGWLSAILFGSFWSLVFWIVTVKWPSKKEEKRVFEILYRELSQNLDLISLKRFDLISWHFYDQLGAQALLSLDQSTGDALMLIYKILQMGQTEPDALRRESGFIMDKFEAFLTSMAIWSDSEKQALRSSYHRAFGALARDQAGD